MSANSRIARMGLRASEADAVPIPSSASTIGRSRPCVKKRNTAGTAATADAASIKAALVPMIARRIPSGRPAGTAVAVISPRSEVVRGLRMTSLPGHFSYCPRDSAIRA